MKGADRGDCLAYSLFMLGAGADAAEYKACNVRDGGKSRMESWGMWWLVRTYLQSQGRVSDVTDTWSNSFCFACVYGH